MSIYTNYFEYIEDIDSLESYEDLVLFIYDNIQEEKFNDFLEFIGNYNFNFECSINDLNSIQEIIIEEFKVEQLNFAISLFNKDIKNFDCRLINKKLNHPIFKNIKSGLRNRILKKIIDAKNIPDMVHSSKISLLISDFIDDNQIISKESFCKCLKDYLVNNNNRESRGYLLAKKIKQKAINLQFEYETPLYNIYLEEDEIQFIKFLTFLELTNSENNDDLIDFQLIIDCGGLFLISCIIFAKDTDKESNSAYWAAYCDWLEIPKNQVKKIMHRVDEKILNFIRINNIARIETISGKNQYVVTFRMHSIVANRPLSREKIISFLIKIIKNQGLIYHETQDQRDIIQTQIDEYYNNYIFLKEENNNQSYSPLPIETLKAYSINKKQVIDFLLPIYNLIENLLIDKLNSNINTYCDDKLMLPQIFYSDIYESVNKVSICEIKKIKDIRKFNKVEKPTVYLNLSKYCIEFKIPTLIIGKEELDNLSISNAKLKYKLNKEANNHTLNLEIDDNDSFLITEEVVIDCEEIGQDLNYQIIIDNKKITGTIKFSYLFNSEGLPINLNNDIEQFVYCVAKKDDILSDSFSIVKKEFKADYNLYKTYYDENSLIIINDKLYGFDKNVSANSGYIINNLIYKNVKVKDENSYTQVIGELPILYFRCPSIILFEENIIVSINSFKVDYSIIYNNLLCDGTDDYFIKIRINSPIFNYNGEKIIVKIFDLKSKKDIFIESFFVLLNLSYKFDKPYYTSESEIVLDSLDFENKTNLFAGHYSFPDSHHLYAYKLKFNDKKIIKLVIPPPLIRINVNDENLLKRSDYWYQELVDFQHIDISTPKEFRDVKLITYDNCNNANHKLKKKGNNSFNTFYLNEFPHSDSKSVNLYLEFCLNDIIQHIFLCKIHYKISQIDLSNFISFIPNNTDFHFNGIKPGLTIRPKFICNPKANYIVDFTDSNNKLIFSKEMSNSNSVEYYQRTDLKKGKYYIKVSHLNKNSFIKVNEKIEDCNFECVYKVDNYSNKILSENTNNKNKVIICNPVYKIIQGKNCHFELASNKMQKFFFNVDFELELSDEFQAIPYLYSNIQNEKQILSNEKLKIFILKKLSNYEYIVKITDKQNNSLAINQYSGKIILDEEGKYNHLIKYKYYKGIIK